MVAWFQMQSMRMEFQIYQTRFNQLLLPLSGQKSIEDQPSVMERSFVTASLTTEHVFAMPQPIIYWLEI